MDDLIQWCCFAGCWVSILLLGFDLHVLLFWVFSLVLHLMSLLSLFLGFKKNIEEQVLMFLPKKIMKVNMMIMMMIIVIIKN